MNGTTPYQDGFYMPARFSSHERTFIAWPTPMAYRRDLVRSRSEYAAVIQAIARFEPVTVIVRPDDARDAAQTVGANTNIDLLEIPINDAWVRDSGWIFVKNDENEMALVQFQFNGWGGRFPADLDMRVGAALADHYGIRLYNAPLICEGGGISVDGEGTLITTEQVMRNPNRYNGLSREAVENHLHDYLGVEKVIWLGLGLAEDEGTDGHVDNIVEYIAPGVVLAQTIRDTSNPNYDLCQENLKRLKNSRDARGRQIEVVEIDILPYTGSADGDSMPVPYVNYYIVNGALVVPMMGGPEDQEVLPILESLYPDREIVPVESTAIARDGGGIGCITQQQPSGAFAQNF
jgi:agmatine deiminase